MFDVGFWELVLVMIVALLVIGPERLPGMAQTLGRWTGRARGMARQFRLELEREARDAVDVADPSSSTPALSDDDDHARR